ncbi:MAG TPA: GNAT family N-acetyltransferase [Sphingomonas sp.]|uniref:GNAT family N-acetyltransferase n=1 Tax=Sphingomonas sp. TaxID=28214 RepID=UPI002CF8960C|nr:GNAT family N-acetyltransferase [Sphingomonas sp.]HMI18870.1 GNAT family N-acetyltransferase [Sphingomonas sp.]
MPAIEEARSAADFAGFGEVCRAYVDWCRERYREMPWFVAEVFGYQALDEELKMLVAKYGPPNGRTMIARIDEQIVAGGAYKTLSADICELKRLFVGENARGLGLGRKLLDTLIASAKADGFAAMRLDTGHLMKEAIALYRAAGFEPIAPYLTYPARLMPYLIFMEKRL